MAAALFGVARAEIEEDRINDGSIAEGLLDAPFAEEKVTVLSAGLLDSGRPVTREVVATLAPYGVDMTSHRSTRLTPAAVEQADLIIGMERRHGREAVLLVPTALPRTFTLKELVRRGEQAGPRHPGQTLAAWLERVADGRERTDLVGRSAEDDVDDPLGGSLADYRATATEIADLILRMARLLWLGAGPADS
jgi:protein-tyrosine phosphatase